MCSQKNKINKHTGFLYSPQGRKPGIPSLYDHWPDLLTKIEQFRITQTTVPFGYFLYPYPNFHYMFSQISKRASTL